MPLYGKRDWSTTTTYIAGYTKFDICDDRKAAFSLHARLKQILATRVSHRSETVLRMLMGWIPLPDLLIPSTKQRSQRTAHLLKPKCSHPTEEERSCCTPEGALPTKGETKAIVELMKRNASNSCITMIKGSAKDTQSAESCIWCS